MKMLSMNMRVKGLENMTHKNIEKDDNKQNTMDIRKPAKHTWNSVWDAVPFVQGNRRLIEPEPKSLELSREEPTVEKPVAVLCGTTEVIEETNEDGNDDRNESAQINCYDLAPRRYPWEEVRADIGPLAPWETESPEPVPNLYPETPPELTSNDDGDTSDDEDVQIIPQSETPLSRTADEENEDNEVQILAGPIPAPGDIFINGRRYTPGTVMSRVNASTMRRAQRKESDSSPGENYTEANNDTFDDLLDSLFASAIPKAEDIDVEL